MDALRSCRRVSIFWLTDPATRGQALQRLATRGVVTVRVLGFPMYRVTIHRKTKPTARKGA
jgi:hypothetical protein